MRTLREVYEGVAEGDREAGLPFVERHAKNWEEASQLRLFEMLDYRNQGYYYFFYDQLPFDRFPQVAPLEAFEYLVVQEGFEPAQAPAVRDLLASRYVKVGEARSEGMQGRGMRNEIYRRKDGTSP